MFKRTDLDANNTPLQYFSDFSKQIGRSFFVKREDMCGSLLGLNSSEARKLEFLLPDIASIRPDAIVVVGSYSSPFIRVLAQMVCKHHVPCNIIYVDDFLPSYTANLATVQLCGAITHGTQTVEYAQQLVEQLRGEGKVVYVLRPGGKTSCAAMGGFALFDELRLDLNKASVNDALVYLASDSGTTQAGMISASSISNETEPHGIRILGVPLSNVVSSQLENVCASYNALGALAVAGGFDGVQLQGFVPEILISTLDVVEESASSIEESNALDLSIARNFYDNTGIIIDRLYGLPVLKAILQDVRNSDSDLPVVFVNPTQSSVPFLHYTQTDTGT